MVIPTNDTTTMHENMQYNIIDNGTKLIDSDKPHRPDSFLNDSDKSYRPGKDNNSEHQSHRPELNTRVDMQSVQQDTTSVRKVPVTVPDVVDSENATCQDSCAKGSSNHSDYWKRVISFGTASADLIIPVDDEQVSRKNSCKRRTHQKRTYKCKANHKYRNTESIPYDNIRYNKPNGCPADSIMFDNDEFQRLNYKYGPFTLDACASAFDAKCPEYCSTELILFLTIHLLLIS